MGNFDAYRDTPFRIKTEGQTITLNFSQGVPATGQGTVTWNIPNPGTDNIPGGQGAYAGIVLLLSEWPLTASNLPQNGRIYAPDPTADRKIHSGDKIGNALVVGAFYEAAKIAQGKSLTTQLIINDLKPNTSYYVGAFAVDSQFRYHTEGVRAYSDKLAGPEDQSVPAVNYLKIGTSTTEATPVLPSDGTGLVPGVAYEFDILLDNTYPYRTNERVYRIRVNGSKAGTYCDLINELNRKLAVINCPPTAPVSPGANELYWDAEAQKLYQLVYNPEDNSLTLTEIPDVIVQDTDPSYLPPGTYWYNPVTKLMHIRTDLGIWAPVTIANFGTVNLLDLQCTDYWFNTTTNQAYLWSGSTWCEVPTVVDTLDPACAPPNLCGAFWFDQSTNTLFKYDVVTKTWIETSAVLWPIAPNALALNTHWFDLTLGAITPLHVWNGTNWIALPNTFVSSTEPATPAPGSYWYNPNTEELQQYSPVPVPTWTPIPVLVWPGDPTVVTSCDLWWNSSTNVLSQWNVVDTAWTPVVAFYDQLTDPSLAPVVAVGTVWFNPTTGLIQVWDGSSWLSISVATTDFDPTNAPVGVVWFNVADKTWYVRTLSSWDVIAPIISTSDPGALPVGTYWYDTSDDSLAKWNGTGWVTVAFTTTPPFPMNGQMWFNTTTDTLYVWDAIHMEWRCATPPIRAHLDPRGWIVFTTGEVGSGMHVKLLNPGGNAPVTSGHADYAAETLPRSNVYDLQQAVEPPGGRRGANENRPYPPSCVSDDAYLWDKLLQGSEIWTDVVGADAVSDVPSYLEIGIGTDGTPDERRMVADQIRRQLGYPIVDVELDKQQIDDCITYALQQFRQKSNLAYKRGFFFLDVTNGKQKYVLSNRTIGYDKIVNVTAVYRFTSAFLSTANAGGAYGQIVLQHLYNMGTYDLTSFYLVSNYVETLELLFATRLTFSFDEASRVLHLYNSFVYKERVLMDVTVERTEQEIMKNRLAINWIREWALSEAMLILAQIRGKYGSLPGAGGGVTLNAGELRDRAERMQEKLLGELDDYQAQLPEDLGYNSQFVIG